ncbi:MAG: SufD family Fe-S cluster assembly protein [Bacteroidetes bacterium]|nr:SufD family Fe-S cluster assembly protein [Bacteroidota bacterium]
MHIKLNDTNCTSHLFGLYILDGDQITDNHTLVDHAMPNCYSNELYKGVIGGEKLQGSSMAKYLSGKMLRKQMLISRIKTFYFLMMLP